MSSIVRPKVGRPAGAPTSGWDAGGCRNDQGAVVEPALVAAVLPLVLAPNDEEHVVSAESVANESWSSNVGGVPLVTARALVAPAQSIRARTNRPEVEPEWLGLVRGRA